MSNLTENLSSISTMSTDFVHSGNFSQHDSLNRSSDLFNKNLMSTSDMNAVTSNSIPPILNHNQQV